MGFKQRLGQLIREQVAYLRDPISFMRKEAMAIARLEADIEALRRRRATTSALDDLERQRAERLLDLERHCFGHCDHDNLANIRLREGLLADARSFLEGAPHPPPQAGSITYSNRLQAANCKSARNVAERVRANHFLPSLGTS